MTIREDTAASSTALCQSDTAAEACKGCSAGDIATSAFVVEISGNKWMKSWAEYEKECNILCFIEGLYLL